MLRDFPSMSRVPRLLLALLPLAVLPSTAAEAEEPAFDPDRPWRGESTTSLGLGAAGGSMPLGFVSYVEGELRLQTLPDMGEVLVLYDLTRGGGGVGVTWWPTPAVQLHAGLELSGELEGPLDESLAPGVQGPDSRLLLATFGVGFVLGG